MIGYAVLIVGVVIILLPIYWCLWRLRRKESAPKEQLDEDGHQLSNINIYDQSHY
jgi:hypothetical protein